MKKINARSLAFGVAAALGLLVGQAQAVSTTFLDFNDFTDDGFGGLTFGDITINSATMATFDESEFASSIYMFTEAAGGIVAAPGREVKFEYTLTDDGDPGGDFLSAFIYDVLVPGAPITTFLFSTEAPGSGTATISLDSLHPDLIGKDLGLEIQLGSFDSEFTSQLVVNDLRLEDPDAAAVIPEPSTVLLLGTGLLGLVGYARRRNAS